MCDILADNLVPEKKKKIDASAKKNTPGPSATLSKNPDTDRIQNASTPTNFTIDTGLLSSLINNPKDTQNTNSDKTENANYSLLPIDADDNNDQELIDFLTKFDKQNSEHVVSETNIKVNNKIQSQTHSTQAHKTFQVLFPGCFSTTVQSQLIIILTRKIKCNKQNAKKVSQNQVKFKNKSAFYLYNLIKEQVEYLMIKSSRIFCPVYIYNLLIH